MLQGAKHELRHVQRLALRVYVAFYFVSVLPPYVPSPIAELPTLDASAARELTQAGEGSIARTKRHRFVGFH